VLKVLKVLKVLRVLRVPCSAIGIATLTLSLLLGTTALAQRAAPSAPPAPSAPSVFSAPSGFVSLFFDYFPNRDQTVELRPRLFLEEQIEPSSHIRLLLSGFAEGLVARRPVVDAFGNRSKQSVTDGVLDVQDANVAFDANRFELLAGYARVTWGKLDELQPTDIVNPLDVSRFFFDGRSEARLPVLLVRGRVHLAENTSLDLVYVPDFRRGRFDRLDEPSSPFNVTPDIPLSVSDREPAFTARNAQGGARLTTTSGRVDWSVSAYRGFEPFALYQLSAPGLIREYPRFTMIGGDFEAVRGKWGVRGEGAAFVDDNFQFADLRVVRGSSFDAGAGIDRRAGDCTLSATVLLHTESYDTPISAPDLRDGRTDVSLIVSADRPLARERYRVRVFGVYNPSESSSFVRAIGVANLRDNLALDGSIGWFFGRGPDVIGRFGDSDFLYMRVKYFF
jgi:hypothetical protein